MTTKLVFGNLRSGCVMFTGGLFLFALQPASARERPPLPDPMPCPIDAPVRVASEDTLKHFSMALASCDATTTIVAPALSLPQVSPVIRIESEAPARLHTTAAPVMAERDTGEPAAPAPTLRRSVAFTPAALSPAPTRAIVNNAALTDAAILSLRPRSYQTAFDGHISAAAARHGVDPLLLHAVIRQESHYRPSAISHAGARGLMQVMPGTGRMLGVNPMYLLDPATNIDAGAKLLRRIWSRFNGRFDLVLAAYNAGDGAVIKYGYRVPPYRETQGYVARVRQFYAQLAAESSLSVPGL